MPDALERLLVSRRQFLRHLGLAMGTALTASVIEDLHAAPKPGKPLHVVIVGAGLAGLCFRRGSPPMRCGAR